MHSTAVDVFHVIASNKILFYFWRLPKYRGRSTGATVLFMKYHSGPIKALHMLAEFACNIQSAAVSIGAVIPQVCRLPLVPVSPHFSAV
jgi:hypothetical protein